MIVPGQMQKAFILAIIIAEIHVFHIHTVMIHFTYGAIIEDRITHIIPIISIHGIIKNTTNFVKNILAIKVNIGGIESQKKFKNFFVNIATIPI
jgi:hypothetical protein